MAEKNKPLAHPEWLGTITWLIVIGQPAETLPQKIIRPAEKEPSGRTIRPTFTMCAARCSKPPKRS